MDKKMDMITIPKTITSAIVKNKISFSVDSLLGNRLESKTHILNSISIRDKYLNQLYCDNDYGRDTQFNNNNKLSPNSHPHHQQQHRHLVTNNIKTKTNLLNVENSDSENEYNEEEQGIGGSEGGEDDLGDVDDMEGDIDEDDDDENCQIDVESDRQSVMLGGTSPLPNSTSPTHHKESPSPASSVGGSSMLESNKGVVVPQPLHAPMPRLFGPPHQGWPFPGMPWMPHFRPPSPQCKYL